MYLIKCYFIMPDKSLDCRFEFLLPDIESTIEVISRCKFDEYDLTKIYPYNKEV